ncbi:MAG: nuclear transport factor 2 family protein, partial [Pseudomonadota bacterium]
NSSTDDPRQKDGQGLLRSTQNAGAVRPGTKKYWLRGNIESMISAPDPQETLVSCVFPSKIRSEVKTMVARCFRRFSQTVAPTLLCLLVFSEGLADASSPDTEEQNKALARAFYEDLWFSKDTDRYDDYVADTYVIHDIGEDKGLTEAAKEQKEIADFFWANGNMSGEIDFQIADGDLVATRWRWQYEPTTFLGGLLKGRDDLPIINVFRFEDGKIVEIWNHRHDIDTGMTLRFTAKGFIYGSLVALIPLAWAISLRRRLRHSSDPTSA